MTCKAATLILFCAAMAGGCVTAPSPGSLAGASYARPLADQQPAAGAESRAHTHVELGTAYFGVGRYDVALDEARVALNDLPGYAPAYHLMGLVYMVLGQASEAHDYFARALNAAPSDPDFNNSYGWFLCQQGRSAEGLERLALAASNPYYRYPTRPYTNAGLCLLKDGNAAAAEAQFLRAAQADPGNGEALYQLALIAYQRGDLAVARERLVSLHQRLEPTSASAWLGLRTERRLGNRDAEQSYAAQLRSRFAASAEYQWMMQGKYE